VRDTEVTTAERSVVLAGSDGTPLPR
jgi:hypothetical protein